MGKDNFNENIEENFTKNMMDRQVEVEMKIVQLTAQQKKALNKKYFECHKSNVAEFYQHLVGLIRTEGVGEFSEKRINLRGVEWSKNFYNLKYRLDKKQYDKLFKYQRNIQKQGNTHRILTVESGTTYTNTITTSKSNYFGRNGYWILRFDGGET